MPPKLRNLPLYCTCYGLAFPTTCVGAAQGCSVVPFRLSSTFMRVCVFEREITPDNKNCCNKTLCKINPNYDTMLIYIPVYLAPVTHCWKKRHNAAPFVCLRPVPRTLPPKMRTIQLHHFLLTSGCYLQGIVLFMGNKGAAKDGLSYLHPWVTSDWVEHV